MIDLAPHDQVQASVAIRNCSDNAGIQYSVPSDSRPRPVTLRPWICHITDVNFHTQQDASRTLPNGRHYLRAEVTYDGGSASKGLMVDVPTPPNRPVALLDP